MRISTILIAASLAIATPVFAEPKATAVIPVSDGPSAHQLALSRRYINLMQGEQLEEMVRGVIQAEAAGGAADLPAEDREFVTNLTVELTADMIPAMMDQLVPIYARTFSESELEALVAFYDTDAGRSIIAKTYSSLPEANAAMMSVMPRMLDKMAARMCEHYGCDVSEVRAEMYRGAGLAPPTGASAPARSK